ncbi:MAG: hypothetical protein RLZZ524_568 [Pseudomonadota bacterium]
MPSTHPIDRPRAVRPRPAGRAGASRSWASGLSWRVWRLCGLWLIALLAAAPGHAAPVELPRLEVLRTEQGLAIEFDARFDLPPGVEDALQKGVALHFVAEAELAHSRWYWRDKRLAQVRRTWRLAYQPLTLNYRVSLGGLAQTYGTLREALRAVQRLSAWRIGDSDDAQEADYLLFRYWLDLDQLPRPLLISIGSQPEWSLRIERTILLPPAR